MYAKLIDPKTNGAKVYNNTGSSARTTNYLKQEAGKEGQEAVFFSASRHDLKADDVTQWIDNNVKGLKATDEKFYSLVLSPSEAELKHIGNDEGKLKEYTRQVMEQYAQNFKLKSGQQLESKDLVWAATIHHERNHRGTDEEVKAGTAKEGDKRPGLQTHVHIIVSARDSEQKITLNPDGRRERFDLTKWQRGAGKQFEEQFGYTAQEHEKLKDKQRDTSRDQARAFRIGERVEDINKLVPKEQQLDPQRVQQIAAEREYDKTFYRLLNRVEERAKEGRPIANAYELLSTGREQGHSDKEQQRQEQQSPQQNSRAVLQAVQTAQQLSRTTEGGREQTEQIGEKKGPKSHELDIDM